MDFHHSEGLKYLAKLNPEQILWDFVAVDLELLEWRSEDNYRTEVLNLHLLANHCQKIDHCLVSMDWKTAALSYWVQNCYLAL